MKELQIKTGQIVFIDDEDYGNVSSHNWSMWGRYVSGWVNGKTTSIHRLVVGANKGEVVDHINHNTLDNRKENLRVCSQSENMRNKRKASNSKHGMNGICRIKYGRMNRHRYRVRITVAGDRKEIGLFDNLEDAQKARIEAEEKYYGEYRYQG